MNTTPCIDHYKNKDVSEHYCFRPKYTEAVFKKIKDFVLASDHFDGTEQLSAVDACCGTGASTVPLTQFCHQVLGFDVSETQIAQTPKNIPNVQFKVASAHDMTSFIQPESVDLVTAATCLHWLDMEKFFKQVDQILKPGGALVVYNYGYVLQIEPKVAQDIHNKYKNIVEKKHHGKYLDMLNDDFQGVKLPYPGWIRDDELSLNQHLTIEHYVDFLRSNSIYDYCNKTSDSDIFEEIAQRLKDAFTEERLRNPDFEDKVNVTWPVFMLMGRKPRK